MIRLARFPKERDCQNGQEGQRLNRRIRKTVRPVVWEGARARSRVLDPIVVGRGAEMHTELPQLVLTSGGGLSIFLSAQPARSF